MAANASLFGFTSTDAATEFNAYSSAFYYTSGTNGWFKNNQTGGTSATYFWGQAEEIECVIDTYEWKSNKIYLPEISSLLNGFIRNNGLNWTATDGYNDDVMWACLAFARGGVDTGNTNYCNIARTNFDACYARAWSTNLGGGLYWYYPANASKNACVNGPGSIAASLLSSIYNDASYWSKASNIYFWERSVLFNANNGQIYDNIATNGEVSEGPTTYNQGTFIGAADLLGLTNDALLAANYTMNNMSTLGVLPQYGTNNNNSGFNAIFIRWMARFMKDRALQTTYQPWLQINANAAWNIRRATDNLSWCNWLQPTATSYSLYSWDGISSMEAMQAVDPTQSPSPGIVSLTNTDAASASSFAAPGNWSPNVAPAWSNNCVVSGYGLRTPTGSGAYNFYGGALMLTNGGALRLTATGNSTVTFGTELSIDSSIVSAWSRPVTLAGNIVLQPDGGVFDPQGLGGFYITASISGPGGLTVASDNDTFGGTLFLGGVNTYTGGTVIDGPDTLTLTNYGTLGSSNAPLAFFNEGDSLTIPHSTYETPAYGTLNLGGMGLSVGELTGGGGRIANNSTGGLAVLSVGNGNTGGGMFSGVISDRTYSGAGLVALTKVGTGTITLAGSNTYSGSTSIIAGTLALNGQGALGGSTNIGLAAGVILDVSARTDQTLTLNAGQALTGAGVVNGGLTALAGSTVVPAVASVLTVSGNISLGGTTSLNINRTNAQNCSGLFSGLESIQGGGALTVANSGPLPLAGDVFQLFNAPAPGFSSIALPALTTNSWINRIAIDGSIQVAGAVSLAPLNLTVTNIGPDSITLQWPADHIGWRLEEQTSSIGTNWVEVPGASTNDMITIPIAPTNAALFLRLVFP